MHTEFVREKANEQEKGGLQVQRVDERVRNDCSRSSGHGVAPWRQNLDFGLSGHCEDSPSLREWRPERDKR